MPLLSIVVPNYNNGPYIGDCLESVLNQTFQDYEILVADDCSRDDSLEIIKKYRDKYPGIVRTILNPVNVGVTRNRQQAILQAGGTYVTTLDGDDYYYHREKLAREMALIRSYKEERGADIIAFSDTALVKKDKTFICKRSAGEEIKQGKILDDIMTRTCLIPLDFVMSKAAFCEVGGYDTSIPIYEDWDLKIRLAAKYDFHYTGIVGTAYRRHGSGLSSAPLPYHIKWLKRILKKNLSLVGKDKRNDIGRTFQVFIDMLKNRHVQHDLEKKLATHLKNKKRFKALKAHLQIVAFDPRRCDPGRVKQILALLSPLKIKQAPYTDKPGRVTPS